MVDEAFAARVRAAVGPRPDLVEKRMFGGLAFLVGGHMAVAVHGRSGGLMVRVPPGRSDALLAEPGVGLMEMGSRSMAGWLLVDQSVLTDDDDLRDWVAEGVGYVETLPPK